MTIVLCHNLLYLIEPSFVVDGFFEFHGLAVQNFKIIWKKFLIWRFCLLHYFIVFGVNPRVTLFLVIDLPKSFRLSHGHTCLNAISLQFLQWPLVVSKETCISQVPV